MEKEGRKEGKRGEGEKKGRGEREERNVFVLRSCTDEYENATKKDILALLSAFPKEKKEEGQTKERKKRKEKKRIEKKREKKGERKKKKGGGRKKNLERTKQGLEYQYLGNE